MADIWRRVRGPFVLPMGLHRCAFEDWEPFDCDAAGCRICGAAHRCDAQTCPLVSTDGRQVCEITGYCVKNTVFADDEYVTTVSSFTRPAPHQPPVVVRVACSNSNNSRGSSSRSGGGGGGGRKRKGGTSTSTTTHHHHHTAAAATARKRMTDCDQVHGWVRDILCSAGTRDSILAERDKRVHRLNGLFTRLAKRGRSRTRPLNLIAICTAMAAGIGTTRTPEMLGSDALNALAWRCTESMVLFFHSFLDAMRVVLPTVKMQGFVVGVLYLMRNGICLCDSVEVLPRVEELRAVLPLENQLHARFQLSTKIITEAENTIKSTLRGLSRHQLSALGFGAVYY
jgi:UL92 family